MMPWSSCARTIMVKITVKVLTNLVISSSSRSSHRWRLNCAFSDSSDFISTPTTIVRSWNPANALPSSRLLATELWTHHCHCRVNFNVKITNIYNNHPLVFWWCLVGDRKGIWLVNPTQPNMKDLWNDWPVEQQSKVTVNVKSSQVKLPLMNKWQLH